MSEMSDSEEELNLPPPSSQSQSRFASFNDFVPNDEASSENEFDYPLPPQGNPAPEMSKKSDSEEELDLLPPSPESHFDTINNLVPNGEPFSDNGFGRPLPPQGNPVPELPESDSEEELNRPPPPSQSHFAKFQNFRPNDDASFDNEFGRLAASQEWIPGSQEFKVERTIAMREEVKHHYFSQPPPLVAIKEEPGEEGGEDPAAELSQEEINLKGHQGLCLEIGIIPADTVDECKKELKATFVNIVDLIDARRTGKQVKIWDDFEAFGRYTLDGHSIDPNEAKKGGILDSLLQRIRGIPGLRRRKRKGGRGGGGGGGVVSGRVTKVGTS